MTKPTMLATTGVKLARVIIWKQLPLAELGAEEGNRNVIRTILWSILRVLLKLHVCIQELLFLVWLFNQFCFILFVLHPYNMNKLCSFFCIKSTLYPFIHPQRIRYLWRLLFKFCFLLETSRSSSLVQPAWWRRFPV